jgi:hypothetical protein
MWASSTQREALQIARHVWWDISLTLQDPSPAMFALMAIILMPLHLQLANPVQQDFKVKEKVKQVRSKGVKRAPPTIIRCQAARQHAPNVKLATLEAF